MRGRDETDSFDVSTKPLSTTAGFPVLFDSGSANGILSAVVEGGFWRSARVGNSPGGYVGYE